ncbi:LacI family DNA-binding transcriptional regulator [Streptomyces griseiscabiei]|uniref:LacI family DNA-binding transcriptional regulator n=1 Tax=Streptomyces griseiscabiei TaxID=2993540 RepID=A0ABU4LFN8_9ACTN|nr:LacI family DNA-binding transcriptional regulator [Streptomyces griseiscabiei]MBZ3900432.1 LacI family DNA-binding transcriptional regulator [Streptomyces griseiscabiei]MDX2914600.1 LacI family DNA-binding transcriptional regulator [Streptomyces griseiscabiei]
MDGAGAAQRRPTITDVARLAGVSPQTVSRYLQFKGGLKPVTVERVESAIRELDYRPNLVARSMRTRKTGRLAVLMPAMAFNPSRMLAGASATAHAAQYFVDVVSAGGGVQARSERLLELADSGQYEGILSLAPVLPAVEGKLHQRTTVVISADFDDEMRGIGELADATPLKQMIEHLAAIGHSRFLHVAGDAQFASARARRQSYLSTVERLGLESVGVFDGDWSGESGIEAIRSLPSDARPTAVIAANDLVAAGVVRGARERGWDVPGDISVTGWDNAGVGQFMTPSLTTVDVDLERLGSKAMTKLLASLRYSTPAVHDDRLFRIIWRESTAAPPAQGPSGGGR